jgi:hypothetical protein
MVFVPGGQHDSSQARSALQFGHWEGVTPGDLYPEDGLQNSPIEAPQNYLSAYGGKPRGSNQVELG